VENGTHSCFRFGTSDPYYRKVYTNQFLTDCSNVATRFMWDSGCVSTYFRLWFHARSLDNSQSRSLFLFSLLFARWGAGVQAGVATPLNHAAEIGTTLAMRTSASTWHYAALKSTIRSPNGTHITRDKPEED
jgi:hypothetical protein